MATRRTSPVDLHVAKRLLAARLAAGLTQEYVAGELGVAFQQLQKYEHGINRISAGRLYDIAAVLGVPIAYFFEGLADTKPAKSNRKPRPNTSQLLVAPRR
jgi:transcriptional regulator with XRE-family HTH domain